MKHLGRMLSFLLLPLLIFSLTQNSKNDSIVDTKARPPSSTPYAIESVYASPARTSPSIAPVAALTAAAPSSEPIAVISAATASPAPVAALATARAPAVSHGEKRIEQEDISVKRGLNDDVVVSMQRLLIYYGYLSNGSDDGIFGKNTEQAVKRFQETNGLWVTGVIDGETYDALYYGTIIKNGEYARQIVYASTAAVSTPLPTSIKTTLSPTRTPVPSESRERKSEMVWIPKSGKRYHRRESCSNMKNPKYVTIDEAIRRGFTPCKKCY